MLGAAGEVPVADVRHGHPAVHRETRPHPRGREAVLRPTRGVEVVGHAEVHRQRDHQPDEVRAEEERLQPRHFDDPALKERYLEHGFVIIASVVGPEELARLRAEAVALSERAPAARGSPPDRHGRPCPEPSAYQFTDASKSDDPLTWQSSEQAPTLARIN